MRAQDLIGARETDLILKRILSFRSPSGVRERQPVPAAGTRRPGGTLVDIHGQHEQQSLLASTKQLHAVDAFGSTATLRTQYETAYREWRDLTADIDAPPPGRASTHGRVVTVSSPEIEQAGLSVDEEDRLSMERQRLSHAHRLRELAESSYAVLQEDERGLCHSWPRSPALCRNWSKQIRSWRRRSPGSPSDHPLERRDRSSARVCR